MNSPGSHANRSAQICKMPDATEPVAVSDQRQLTGGRMKLKAPSTNVKLAYRVTTVETAEHYHQIITWTLQSRKDKNQTDAAKSDRFVSVTTLQGGTSESPSKSELGSGREWGASPTVGRPRTHTLPRTIRARPYGRVSAPFSGRLWQHNSKTLLTILSNRSFSFRFCYPY